MWAEMLVDGAQRFVPGDPRGADLDSLAPGFTTNGRVWPANRQCTTGAYCSTAGACTFDCRVDDDCGGTAICDDRGRCQRATDVGAGGCCDAGAPGEDPRGALAAALLGLATLAHVTRRRAPRGHRRGR